MRRFQFSAMAGQYRDRQDSTSLQHFRSAFRKSEPITAMSSKRNSIGMSRTRASATPTSNPVHRNSTARSNDPTDPTSKSSTSFSATRAMSTLTPNWPSGSNSTTSPDHTALTMGKRLTKRSEKSYNDMKRCLARSPTLQLVTTLSPLMVQQPSGHQRMAISTTKNSIMLALPTITRWSLSTRIMIVALR